MICARCGTEHNDPEKICPRCFYGRPKEKKKMNKLLAWAGGIAGGLVVAAIASVFIASAIRLDINQRRMDGSWENDEMALILNRDEQRFQLINGQNVLDGRYRLSEDELRLVGKKNKRYVYEYVLEDNNTLTLSFTDGDRFVQETLKKINYIE